MGKSEPETMVFSFYHEDHGAFRSKMSPRKNVYMDLGGYMVVSQRFIEIYICGGLMELYVN